MQLIPLKTRVIQAKSDLLTELEIVLKKVRLKPKNGDIWIVTSKVLAVCQGRLAKVQNDQDLKKLVKKESDHILSQLPYCFTIKDGIMIPRAGIDLSNITPGQAVLWPKASWSAVRALRQAVCAKYGIDRFGVVITDSTCRPLRHGTSNIALSWAGFAGVEDARGQPDLYGRPLRITKRAMADCLASAAYVLTGEGGQSIPFVWVRDAPVQFGEFSRPRSFQPKDCLFAGIYTSKLRKLKI